MRIAIVAATAVGIATARHLVEHGHDVVIVDADRARIDELSGELDCAFIHGDGSRPQILREIGPSHTDVLLCLADDDQDNIISSLVGRSVGFERVMTKISDPDFEHICVELGLDNTINADQTTARSLVDEVEGRATVELSTVLRGDVRFFVFTARKDDAGRAHDLSLPQSSRVLFAYRDEEALPADDGFEIREGDDVVLLTRAEHLEELRERWAPDHG
ncbi:MAG TPA: TrkA family potassium uptake protein [Steroidobacteraceae bacterium]|nr:TrkA family potassium uptake protein [Steroidobacteraceae bacterium]